MNELIDFAELRESARAVLTAECSSERLHKFIDGDVDFASTLRNTMIDLGWYGLPVPEEHGGLGLGCGDLAAIYYELGRCCAPSDYLGCMLVAHALLLGQSTTESITKSATQCATWLPALASGQLKAAIGGFSEKFRPDARVSVVEQSANALVLSGSLAQVNATTAVDLVLLQAVDGAGETFWILLDVKRSGIAPQAVPAVDRTRGFCSMHLDRVSVPRDSIVAAGAAAARMTAALLDHTAMALACDSIGGAEAIFEKTVAYLNTRKQFNRLIGSFQALKHRCADLKIALVAASASVDDAVEVMRGGVDNFGAACSMAKAYAADVYARVAADAVQLHGGIGFTWEQDCHIFLKRAKLNQQLFGNGSWHRDRVAEVLLQRFVASV